MERFEDSESAGERIADAPSSNSLTRTDTQMQKIENLVSQYEQKVFNLALHLTNDQSRSEQILLDVIANAADDVAAATTSAEDFAASIYKQAIGQAAEISSPLEQSVTKIVEKIYAGSEASELSSGARGSTAVESAMNRLPLEYKLVFWLRDVAALTFEEIGEALELSDEEVRARLHRARLMVRRQVVKDLGAVSEVEAPVEIFRTVPQALLV